MSRSRALTQAASFTALALVSLTGVANVLTNPGFEADAVPNAAPVATVTGWSNLDNAYTASTNGTPARTGTGSLQLFSAGGGYTIPEARQTFAATPGQTWDFQGYILSTNALPAGNTFALLKVVWTDASNVELAPTTVIAGTPNYAFPGIESAPVFNSGSTPNTWIFTRAAGIAPPNTAWVTVIPLLVDENASVVFLDDLQLTNTAVVPLNASIISPANLDQVLTNFTINAAASVTPGAVTNVDFYMDNVLQGNDETSPYSFGVTSASLGAHTLKVVAKANTGASVTSSVVNVTAVTAVTATVTVDPAKPWLGFMNVFDLPQNGGAFQFPSSWGVGDLRASFSGSTLTLSPNTIGDPNGYWYVTTNSPSIGNKIMEANMYVESNGGQLGGKTVVFTGTCINNTMTTNGAFNGPLNPYTNGWTCVAFIKDFAPDYSSFTVSSTVLTNGSTFSISLATVNDPARHVQYGFQTIGPCVWGADPVLASYGNVQVGPPVPAAPTLLSPAVSGGNFTAQSASQSGFNYVLQGTPSLAPAAWSNLQTNVGTGGTLNYSVPVTPSNPERFFRLRVQ